MEFLIPLFTALPYLVAFGLSLLVVVLVFGATTSLVAGAGVVVTSYVLSAIVGAGGIRLGLNLGVADFFLVLVGISFAFRFFAGHYRWREPISLAWLALGFVWFGLFAMGLGQHGSAAGVAFRGYYYLWVTVAYALTFRPDTDTLRRCITVFGLGMACLMVVVLYRWTVIATGTYEGESWRESATSLRVISAQSAQALALVLVAGIAGWTRLSTPRPLWSGLAFAAVPLVLVLQHRTVWLACLSALVVAVLLGVFIRRARLSGALLPLVVCGLLLAALFLLAPQSAVTSNLGEAASTNTLIWRIDSWQSLFSLWLQGGPQTWLMGKPFGASMTRFVESSGLETSVSAHSQYVSLLIHGGVAAASLYAFLMYRTGMGLWRRMRDAAAGQQQSEVPALLLCVVAILVFGGAYNIDYAQGLLLGMAMLVAHASPEPQGSQLASAARRGGFAHARPTRLKVQK